MGLLEYFESGRLRNFRPLQVNHSASFAKNINLTGNIKLLIKLQDYLAENVEISLKNKVTTLKRLLDTKKEPFESALLKYGAGGGIRTHAYRNHNPRS